MTDRDPRRRFNKTERSALYRIANGKCEWCSEELGHDWEPDHDTPHSRGGPTDVINGRALCRPCNRKKGNRMPVEPRPWQKLFISKYHQSNPEDFLLVACPAAGKTLATCLVARDLLNDGVIDRVFVVVPTYPLREQWRKAFAQVGVVIDEETSNNPVGEMVTRGGTRTQGWVVTYQSLSATPKDHRALNARRRTLAILDEVHHLSTDGGAWGRAAIDALEPCVRRLSLSGTPFRGDKTQIPFVEYEEGQDGVLCCRYKDAVDGTSYPYGFDYSYGVALADNPSPVRPVVFEYFDGDVEWMERTDAEPTRVRVSDDIESKKTRSRANRHVLNAAGEWLSTVLVSADNRLQMTIQEGDLNAGGIIICLDTRHADAVAARLREISSGPVYTAISKDETGRECSEEARQVIERFRAGQGRWLVAVQMVTEGVDIPRLRVGVYATTTRTPLFFRQVVGRVVRRRFDLPEELDQTSYLFVPKEPAMMALADSVRKEVIAGLVQSADDTTDDDGDGDSDRDITITCFPEDPYDAFRESTADDAGVLVPGYGTLSAEMVQQVVELSGQSYGVVASVLATVANIGFTPPVTNVATGATEEKPAHRIARRKGSLEKLLRQYTSRFMELRGADRNEYGDHIRQVKTEVYRAADIYRPGMTSREYKSAYDRADVPALDLAIKYVRDLLSEL